MGDNSNSAVNDIGIACAVGYNSAAKGSIGSWIVVAEWEIIGTERKILGVKSSIVDGEKIKADTYYKLIGGEFVEAK